MSGGIHGKNRLMGNSLLDFNVFGRRAGMASAEWVRTAKPGKPTLEHAARYAQELEEAGVKMERKAPSVLPDYRGERTLARVVDLI